MIEKERKKKEKRLRRGGENKKSTKTVPAQKGTESAAAKTAERETASKRKPTANPAAKCRRRGGGKQSDWRQLIDADRSAAIYRKHREELDGINELLSSVSLRGSAKKRSRRNVPAENDRDRKRKAMPNGKTAAQRRKIGKCLLSDSDSSENEVVERRRPSTNKEVDKGWDCGVCSFWNVAGCGQCAMCGSVREEEADPSMDLSVLMDTLSISQSPDRLPSEEEVWDLSADISKAKATTKKKRKEKKRKVRSKAVLKPSSILNTSSTTATWKCHRCKTSIPIDTFECPKCG